MQEHHLPVVFSIQVPTDILATDFWGDLLSSQFFSICFPLKSICGIVFTTTEQIVRLGSYVFSINAKGCLLII